MKVVIKTVKGEKFDVECELADTVEVIKNKISAHLSIDVSQ